MINVLKSSRLHIGILGKRNAGKSSLLNFLTNQDVSIVSEIAGTTTDVVEKTMELLPIGPVVFFDTAGIDDVGNLGEQRIKSTLCALDRFDIALIVCDWHGIDEFEIKLIKELQKRNTPFGIIINKNDAQNITEQKLEEIKSVTTNFIDINTKDVKNINTIKQLIINILPENFYDEETIINDIVQKNDIVVQVIPIDKEAPKGRLILPQNKTIRNALDNGVISVITRSDELKTALESLKKPPKLVITDSQVFNYVNSIIPKDVLLTSYSILFARQKGDLAQFVAGSGKIKELKENDKILICESCTHQASCQDIGRVKIPNLIKKFTGKNLNFDVYSGHDFPQTLNDYSLIIHCGACMTNRKEVLSRILQAKEAQIPITNYGVTIAYCLGILDRAIEPFNCRL